MEFFSTLNTSKPMPPGSVASFFKHPGRTQQNAQRTVSIPTLVLQELPQEHILLYVYRSFMAESFFRKFGEILYLPPWVGKIFKLMLFRLLKKAFASEEIESRGKPLQGKISSKITMNHHELLLQLAF